ncbi:MAG: arsenate reductase family protein [Sulfurimonas sp.]|jgi:Spx/MgsR family transcriptional regulator|nr:arsenate reductase family protein [Sulfurimonas sp.]
MIKVYGIKNCDSVKKALSFFKKYDIEYELCDFNKQAPSCEMIDAWLQKTDIDTLFNARSTTYRELKLKELELDSAAKREWLCKENRLIKRPVVQYKDTIIVGFNEDNYKGVFL